MSNYKIEKHGNLPELALPKNRKYPFNEMEIGDVFYVGLDETKRVRSAAHMYGKRTGLGFQTRRIVDGDAFKTCVMRVL